MKQQPRTINRQIKEVELEKSCLRISGSTSKILRPSDTTTIEATPQGVLINSVLIPWHRIACVEFEAEEDTTPSKP